VHFSFQLRITVENLVKLWDLMETSEKEKAPFTKVASVFGSLEEEIVSPGLLSCDTLKKVCCFRLFPWLSII
jgi:Ase1/PRC1/MAP65 family protein